MRNLLKDVQWLIEACPGEQGGPKTRHDWLLDVAALVDEMIRGDRSLWEAGMNRPLDIFFSNDPGGEYPAIRQRMTAIQDELRRSFRPLAEGWRREAEEHDCVYEWAIDHQQEFEQFCRPAEPNLFNVCESAHWLLEEGLAKPNEFFPTGQRHCGGIEDLSEEPQIPFWGDCLSTRVILRLRVFSRARARFMFGPYPGGGDYTVCPDLPLTTVVRRGIDELERRLLRSRGARAARPHIVLGKVYFGCWEEPDTRLLHGMADGPDHFHWYVSAYNLPIWRVPSEEVKKALEEILRRVKSRRPSRKEGRRECGPAVGLLAKVKLRAALLTYHQYEGPRPKLQAATQQELADILDVPQYAISRAIRKHFGRGWWDRYKAVCKEGTLRGFLRKLDNGTTVVEAPDHDAGPSHVLDGDGTYAG